MANSVTTLTDILNMLSGYIENKIRVEFPEIDVTDGSPFQDLFISTMKTIMAPFVTIVNEIELRTDTENMVNLPSATLDEIGQGSYFLTRRVGTRAIGEVTFSFKTISDTTNLTIPLGIVVATDEGYAFQTISKSEFTPMELYTMYNATSYTYDVSVLVEAVDTGEEYCVGPYKITMVQTPFNSNLTGIKNINAMAGGTTEESNQEYFNRIKSFYTSRQLGTEAGYKQFIFENFPEILEAYIAGLGDPYMTRDKITYTDDGVQKEVTVGGCIDIYLKGCIHDSMADSAIFNSRNLVLVNAIYDNIDQSSVFAYKASDTNKTHLTITISSCDPSSMLVSINANSCDVGDVIIVQYQYTVNGTTTTTMEQFSIGLLSFDLQAPFDDIISIKNLTQDFLYQLSSIGDWITLTLSNPDFAGTSKERWVLTFADHDVHNGDEIEVTYSHNRTANLLDAFFNIQENRIVTTNLLFREAVAKYVNIAFKIKMKDGYTYTPDILSSFTTSLDGYFADLSMGDPVQESDIVNILYANENVGVSIAYVALPLDAMYVPDSPNDAVSFSPRTNGTPITISVDAIGQAMLNKISITTI